MSDTTVAFIEYAIGLNDSSLNSYLLKDKYFSQYVAEDEESK